MPNRVKRRMSVLCPDGRHRSLGVYTDGNTIRGRITVRRNGERFDITGSVINGVFRPDPRALHLSKVADWAA